MYWIQLNEVYEWGFFWAQIELSYVVKRTPLSHQFMDNDALQRSSENHWLLLCAVCQ